MDSCCPKEALACLKLENVQKNGTTLTLGEMQMYHVGSGPKAILYSFDIFGFGQGRTYQICDYLASKGYQVFMPDFFLGNPYPNKPIEPDVVDCIKRFPFDSTVAPLLKEHIMPFIKKQGVTDLAVLGTCWGAWNSFKIASLPEFKELIRCGISVHPSLKIEEMFEMSVEEMINKMPLPQLVVPSKNELPRIKPKGELIKLMAKNVNCAEVDATGVDCGKIDCSSKVIVCLFDDMFHGYFTRGKMGDPGIKESVEKTCWLIECFLKNHL